MDPREALRAIATAVSPDQAVTVPAAWLLEVLNAEPPPRPAVSLDLTVEQLAAQFGRKASTVRGWLERGDFPGAYRRQGREWRVPASAVQGYQERQRASASTPAGSVELGAWRSHVRPPAA